MHVYILKKRTRRIPGDIFQVVWGQLRLLITVLAFVQKWKTLPAGGSTCVWEERSLEALPATETPWMAPGQVSGPQPLHGSSCLGRIPALFLSQPCRADFCPVGALSACTPVPSHRRLTQGQCLLESTAIHTGGRSCLWHFSSSNMTNAQGLLRNGKELVAWERETKMEKWIMSQKKHR